MLQRILVAVVGVPLLLLVLVWAPEWAALALLDVLAVIGAYELLRAVCGKKKAAQHLGLAGAMAVIVISSAFWNDPDKAGFADVLFPLALTALLVLLFLSVILLYGTERAIDFQGVCAILVAGIAIPLAFSCLLRLRLMENGGGLVLIPLVAAFCSDSAALFTGMACGKHKLSPKVSPKKTVEGAVGGLIGGAVGMVLFRIVFYLCTLRPLHVLWCVVLGLVGALLGQIGDLSFSAIKREYGIKDYGNLLPGHGGVLDRFDSVIFAAPVIWLIITLVEL